MADLPTISFPPQYLTNLTSALRTQTNAILEVKAALAVIAEKLDRLVDSERAEADDIREIRRAILDTTKDISETRHNVRETREELKEITGEHPLSEELQQLENDRRRPGVIVAVVALVEHVGKLPVWLRWFLGTSLGGGLVELAHRYFHF
jgi:chromosome segregation ATPase